MTSRFMKERTDLCSIASLCAIALMLGGCGKPVLFGNRELTMPLLKASGTLDNPASAAGLPLVKLRLGNGLLVAEIAATPAQAAVGLAFRAGLAPGNAMLFTYPTPHKVVFHMKDTCIPLSAAYIDSMGNVLEIHDMKPGGETPVVSGSNAVRFVLEVNRGWFERNGVASGSRIYVER